MPSYDATARVLLSLVSRLHTEQSIVLSTVAAFEHTGASIVRTHDVPETVDALKVWHELQQLD